MDANQNMQLIRPSLVAAPETIFLQGFVNGDDGKLLDATYVFLGDDNSEISERYHTDNSAYYVNIPDTFHWVNFYSPGYVSTVFAVSDLVGANGLTLEKEKASSYWWLVLVAFALIAFAKKRKKQVGKVTKDDIMPWVYIGGGLLTFNLIEKLLQKFGIWNGPGQKGVDNETADPNSPWKPGYWKTGNGTQYILDRSTAESFASTIEGAFGLFQDDFNAILSVFSQLRTKSEVSYLADVFQQKKGQDLLNFLTNGGGILPWDGLSDSHLNTIINLVKALPAWQPNG